jgi:hypothetical protein
MPFAFCSNYQFNFSNAKQTKQGKKRPFYADIPQKKSKKRYK